MLPQFDQLVQVQWIEKSQYQMGLDYGIQFSWLCFTMKERLMLNNTEILPQYTEQENQVKH